MIPTNHYCYKVQKLDDDDPDKIYHDTVHGFPCDDDDQLFERLTLEINQAGLNWSLIMKKQKNFQAAFDDFSVNMVAQYDDQDIERLLKDSGIIRHKLKIQATIYNARKILELQDSHGYFFHWLDQHRPLELKEWTKLFRKQFKFVGPEIVKEFLMGIGFLPGAHHPECVIHRRVKELEP